MSSYNSVNYASDIGQPSTGTGLPITDARVGLLAQDAKIQSANDKTKFVEFQTATQALAIGDIINLGILPQGARVVRIGVANDTATTSATIQIGAIQGGTTTAGFFTTSALSLASVTRQEALTNQANLGSELAAATTVIATIAGAAIPSGTILKFTIEFLTN